MTNEVTLMLTGDEDSLERAISNATRQVQDMDSTVATASASIEQSSSRMDRMAERADNLATRTGTLAGGIGALAGGMALLGVESDSTAAKVVGGLSVAIGTLSGVMDIVAIASSSAKVAMIGSKVAMVASTAATGVATAAQWALNVAMTANPIGLIIAAIVALVAIIVVIATKTTWFQDLWRVTWNGIKVAAQAVGSWFVDTLWGQYLEPPFMWIGNAIWGVINTFKALPGKIGEFFGGLGDKIAAPFRWAFNFVADAWNNTIGRLSWTVPSWVPVIGGNTIAAPKLPKFHSGGVIGGGAEGTEVAILARVGERVQTREQQAASDRPHVTYNIRVDGARFRDGTHFEDWLDDLRNDGRGGGEGDG